jgi:molybdate transport system substrate-binding protein
MRPMVGPRITGISSMATRAVLGDLVRAHEARAGVAVAIESVGGVDAARRVAAGEVFDAVFLAADAIDKLIVGGSVVAGSRVDLFRSGVAVAVRAGAPRPDIGSEDALRRAVLAARRIGYSTGPSGTQLMKLFERWGILDAVRDRLVQAMAGVPVGASVANGEVDLGFQQLSELMSLPGIDVVGPLPPAVQITTVFSGAVCARSGDAAAARALLAFMASPEVASIKQRHGMESAAT